MTVGRTLVAIPAWNEEGSIAGVIAKVREHRPEADILVVSDGSTDATADVVSGSSLAVGGAMRTAFLHAARNDYAALVQVDADGQHEPAELDALIDGLADADIVVGTRFHPNSTYGVWGPRKWAMKLLSWSISRMAGTRITDTTSGFRSAGPRAIALFAVDYPAEYLGDTVGSLAIAVRHGLVVREAPVTMYFREYGRPSKNAIWATLYLGRAALALLVTFLQGGARVSKEDVS